MKREYKGVPNEILDKVHDVCWYLLQTESTNSRRLNGYPRLSVQLAGMHADRTSGMVVVELCRSRAYRYYTDFNGNKIRMVARAKWQHTQKLNKLFKMLAPYRA